MKKQTMVFLGMGVLIMVLLSILIVPKITTPIKAKYQTEGCNICSAQIMNQMISDLQTRGYTTLNVNNQTINLAIIDLELTRKQQTD